MISPLRERDGALVRNWYIACLSRELGANRTLARLIYDTALVLFRDEAGRAVCLPDRCLHRATPLSEGRVSSGCLSCPYHGWRYDGRGRVCEIPAEGPQAAIPSALAHKPFPCIESDGCIWVWMGDGEPEGKPCRFPFVERKEWSHYFMVTDFENEVTNLVENFMDVPHTVFVHRGWFRRRSRLRVPIQVKVSEGTVLVTYLETGDAIGFSGRVLNPRGEPMTHTDQFIGPQVTRVDYGFGQRQRFMIMSQCTPVSTLHTRVYTLIAFCLGPLLNPLLKPFLRYYTRQVIEQDVRIMSCQARNLRGDMAPAFRSTGADLVHLRIERLRDLARRGAPAWRTIAESHEGALWI
jgi:phenylpropionate dioxygenase-like ring-hydroxylating dioxygenase large terminal subunit